MLCKGLPIPNFNPKKDNFFVMLHFTCTCIKFFTKSIQKNIAYFHKSGKLSQDTPVLPQVVKLGHAPDKIQV